MILISGSKIIYLLQILLLNFNLLANYKSNLFFQNQPVPALDTVFPDRFRIITDKIITIQYLQIEAFLLVKHQRTRSRSAGTDFQTGDMIGYRPFIRDKTKQKAGDPPPLERLVYCQVHHLCHFLRFLLHHDHPNRFVS